MENTEMVKTLSQLCLKELPATQLPADRINLLSVWSFHFSCLRSQFTVATLLYDLKVLRIWHAFCRASSRPFLLLFEQFERENDAVSKTIEKFYRDELDSELWHDEKCISKLINLNKTSKWRNEMFHVFYCIIPTSRHSNAAWLLVPTIDWFSSEDVFVNEPHRYQGGPT